MFGDGEYEYVSPTPILSNIISDFGDQKKLRVFHGLLTWSFIFSAYLWLLFLKPPGTRLVFVI